MQHGLWNLNSSWSNLQKTDLVLLSPAKSRVWFEGNYQAICCPHLNTNRNLFLYHSSCAPSQEHSPASHQCSFPLCLSSPLPADPVCWPALPLSFQMRSEAWQAHAQLPGQDATWAIAHNTGKGRQEGVIIKGSCHCRCVNTSRGPRVQFAPEVLKSYGDD